MKRYIIRNARVVLEDKVVPGAEVAVCDGKIVGVGRIVHLEDAEWTVVDAEGLYLGPGFVELHIHGGDTLGFESPQPEAVSRLCRFLLGNGVTTFLPTLQCDLEAIARVAEALRRDESTASRVAGVYVEGPFVSRGKRGGILEETIRKPDCEYLDQIIAAADGHLSLMTVAPELAGAEEIVRRLTENAIVPCWGHSECRVDQVPRLDGFRSNVTHLFNGMSPISHKDAGLAMLPFLDPETYFELNGDGIHVNEAAVQMCYRHLNLDRMILISDAVVSAGRGPGEYRYFDRTVVSGANGVRYEDGTLIGSNCLIPEVVRRFIETTGANLADAIRLATLNPCRLLGIDDRRGSIAVDKEADLVLFDDELRVKRVFAGGVTSQEEAPFR